jgi:hypothetical protein
LKVTIVGFTTGLLIMLAAARVVYLWWWRASLLDSAQQRAANLAAILREYVLDAGVAFTQKPFTPASLLRKIRDVLDAPRADPGSPDGRK